MRWLNGGQALGQLALQFQSVRAKLDTEQIRRRAHDFVDVDVGLLRFAGLTCEHADMLDDVNHAIGLFNYSLQTVRHWSGFSSQPRSCPINMCSARPRTTHGAVGSTRAPFPAAISPMSASGPNAPTELLRLQFPLDLASRLLCQLALGDLVLEHLIGSREIGSPICHPLLQFHAGLLQAVRHPVEGMGEVLDFVPADNLSAGAQVTGGDALGHYTEFADRFDQLLGKQQRYQEGGDETEQTEYAGLVINMTEILLE